MGILSLEETIIFIDSQTDFQRGWTLVFSTGPKAAGKSRVAVFWTEHWEERDLALLIAFEFFFLKNTYCLGCLNSITYSDCSL